MAENGLDDLLAPKPVLQSALFCHGIHSDVQGRLTLIHSFHTLPRGPAPEFVLVNLWCYDWSEAKQFHERLVLRDPDGRTLGELEAPPFSLGGDRPRRFSFTRFEAVNFAKAGAHEVRVGLVDDASQTVAVLRSVPLLVE
ncbi:MAG: DUF6941 family protein [Mycobacterium leprae]